MREIVSLIIMNFKSFDLNLVGNHSIVILDLNLIEEPEDLDPLNFSIVVGCLKADEVDWEYVNKMWYKRITIK